MWAFENANGISQSACVGWTDSRGGGDFNVSDLMRPFLAVLVPIEFLLPSPNGTGSLLPGNSVIQTRCQDLVSLPTQHIVLPEPGDPKEQGSEEPKASAVQGRHRGPHVLRWHCNTSDNTRMFSVFCAPSCRLALLGIVSSNPLNPVRHREVKELAQGHTVNGRAGFDLKELGS